MSGNTFLHNFANFGGSIFIGGNLKCTFYSSQNNHTKNTGLISGGAVFSYCQTITISGDAYERNIASCAGAAMATTVKSFTSINSSYIENINKPNPKVRSFMSSYIENITSTHHANGGPVNIDLGDNGLCNISQNQFINNRGIYGGAVYIQVNSTNITYSCLYNQFIGNTAEQTGGAIHFEVIKKGGEYTCSHNLFQSNTAEYYGGAIDLVYTTESTGNGSFRSLNNTFADNTAVSGGAFSIEINYNTSSGSDSIVNDVYYNNTAQQAAALNVAARNLNISKTNFSNNRLQEGLHGSGAAFEVRNAIVRIHDCTLTSNQGSDRAIVINNVLFSQDLKLYKNTGSLYAITSMLEFSGKSKFINVTTL